MKTVPALLCLFLLMPGALAVEVPSDNSIHMKALRSITYAKLIRIQLGKLCDNTPPARRTSACVNFNTVPDLIIERAALPFFQKAVSAQFAAETIKSYASEPHKTLNAKSVEYHRSGAPMTDAENAWLEQHSRSPAGIALLRFADDKARAQAVSDAIFAHIARR